MNQAFCNNFRLSGVYPGNHGQYNNRSQTGGDPSMLNIQSTSAYNNTAAGGGGGTAGNNNGFIQQQQQSYIPNIPNIHPTQGGIMLQIFSCISK